MARKAVGRYRLLLAVTVSSPNGLVQLACDPIATAGFVEKRCPEVMGDPAGESRKPENGPTSGPALLCSIDRNDALSARCLRSVRHRDGDRRLAVVADGEVRLPARHAA